ncbi:sulfurtransferase TusA family protein [Vulgatibacter sp.]|uniref:sulfurtransferase TusA family protein n=1 Tax=Vulgatibacter sp. TaxID=1971226 RepID=UPI00356A4C2B
MSDTPAISRAVDIRSHVCPMTWVRVKLALEQIGAGEHLEVLLRGDEPLRNIPRSAALDGHVVVSAEPAGDGSRLVIRKGEVSC